MGETKITTGALEVDQTLFDFVATSLLPGPTGMKATSGLI